MWCQDNKILPVALAPLEIVSLANFFISQKDTKDEKKQQGQYPCDKLLPKKWQHSSSAPCRDNKT